MKTRTTLIALAVAATALTGLTGLTAPAFARPHGGHWHSPHHGGWNQRYRDPIGNRIDQLKFTIRQNRQAGHLGRYDAERLEYRLSDIAALKREYQWSGGYINQRETWTLNSKIDDLSAQMRYQLRGNYRW